MRNPVFNSLIASAAENPQGFAARIQLQLLLNATARAFGKKGKNILFSGNALSEYAAFTKECMETPANPEILYEEAFKLGSMVRRMSGFISPEDLQNLVFKLYKSIGITISGEIPGDIEVAECFFSRYYSAEQCSVISAMDRGIIAGICGEGSLIFTQRITEGCSCCKACFKKEN